jgi:PncC family amidohydrolase
MNPPSLELTLGQLLAARGLTLATAESCTGGLIGHRLTNVPGSSASYLGGIIAYANDVKANSLGVPWDTLNTHGAVSRETALAMARGVRAALGADIGLSVTGIAGPDGGTPEKPVGTVWIGLSADDDENAWLFVWDGDRQTNKELSAEAALQKVYDYLRA